MPRPSNVFTWATNTNYSGGPAVGTPTKTAPSGADIAEGYEPAQEPGAQGFNYNLNLIGQWISWLSTIALVKIGEQDLTASSGTYAPTSGTLAVKIKGVAGGGGGGGAFQDVSGRTNIGNGGSSGTYFEKWIYPGGGALITGGAFACGAGGAAGDGTLVEPLADGGTGSDSTIVIQGVTYVLKGGVGGHGDTTDTRTGNRIYAGTPPQAGSSSGDVVRADPGGGGANIDATNTVDGARGGAGGSGPWGAGGLGGEFAAGTAGSGFGSGGGGASVHSTGTAVHFNGGAGAPGKWIVEEYG